MSSTAVYRNALAAGTQLLEYRLESVLGAGGFGMTYLARDVNLDKPVAIKEYFPSAIAVRALDGGVLSTDAANIDGYQWGLERFLQEARTLARFTHPHIVRVNRYFEANGTGYMVMDYEDGESLHQALKHEPTPGEKRVRELLFPLLEGLQAVHSTGFLHRDIKPSNIFLRKSGGPVLLDFGSARAALGDSTKTLTSVLTPGYAPLEQYSGDGNQGPWTDIYALGGVLYRVFTGENPPDAVSRLKNDAVPAHIATLIGRVSLPVLRGMEWALALDEKNRPQDVQAWRRALEGKAAVALPARAASGDAPSTLHGAQRAMVTARALPRSTPRPAPRNEAQSGLSWRRIGVAVLAVVTVALVYNAYKQIRALDQDPLMEAIVAQATEDAKRMALEMEQQERARMAQLLPPGGEQRNPEQIALEQREAALREKEQRAAEREAALKQLEDTRAREQAAAAAAQKPAAVVTTRASQPKLSPAETAALEQARRRDPLAAKKEVDFRRADTDGDGYLTPEEARDMPRMNQDFASIDTSGDGRVSLEEFFNYRPVKPPKPY